MHPADLCGVFSFPGKTMHEFWFQVECLILDQLQEVVGYRFREPMRNFLDKVTLKMADPLLNAFDATPDKLKVLVELYIQYATEEIEVRIERPVMTALLKSFATVIPDQILDTLWDNLHNTGVVTKPSSKFSRNVSRAEQPRAAWEPADAQALLAELS